MNVLPNTTRIPNHFLILCKTTNLTKSLMHVQRCEISTKYTNWIEIVKLKNRNEYVKAKFIPTLAPSS